MSEEKKSRSIEEIQQEYASVCAKAGEAQYRISRAKADLLTFNQRLLDLNLEAMAVAAEKEAEKKVEEAEVVNG